MQNAPTGPLFSFENEVGNVVIIVNQMGNVINAQLVIQQKQNILASKDYPLLIEFVEAIESALKKSILFSDVK